MHSTKKEKENNNIQPLLSFEEFLLYFFFQVEGSRFECRDFHIAIINRLNDYIITNNSKNLSINIPPRFGKTTIMTYFIAYGLTYFTDSEYIYTSYSASLAREKGIYEVCRIFDNPEYIKQYGAIEYDKRESGRIITKQGGKILAVSNGQAITGLGTGKLRKGFAGAIIIDDPIKPEDSFSTLKREKNIRFYRNTLKSRRNSSSTPILSIMQRLHMEDLCSVFEGEEKSDWDTFKQEGFIEGRSIWEERKSTKELLHIKNTDPFTFYSQFQQTPIIDGGEIIRKSYFGDYDPKEDYTYNKISIVCDTAFKTATANDYSVLMVVGTLPNRSLHIIDIVRGKYEFPKLKIEALRLHNKYPIATFYIEDRASGSPLIQVLREKRVAIRALNPTRDKYTRLQEQIDYISSGFISLPKQSRWKEDFIDELICFRSDNSHSHDDQVDALVYAVMVHRKYGQVTNYANILKKGH